MAYSFENNQPDFMLQNFSAYFLNAPRLIIYSVALSICSIANFYMHSVRFLLAPSVAYDLLLLHFLTISF